MAAAQKIMDEHKDGMTKEKSDEVAAILAEADQLKVQIEQQERIKEGKKFSEEPANPPAAASHGFRATAPGEGDAPVDEKSWREFEVKTAFGSRKFRFHVPLAVQGNDYKSAFESYVRNGGVHGMKPTDLKTLTEGVDNAGGFLVPEDYQVELLKKTATNTVIRGLARVIQTSRDIARWPRVVYTTDDKYTWGGRITWTGEIPASATTHRVTEPVFGNIDIAVYTAMASLPLSNDLIQDSAFDMMGITTEMLGEAFALGEDDVFINGSGIARPMGILTEVDGNGPASVSSGGASNFTADGLIALYYALPAQYRNNARFVVDSTSMLDIEKLKDGQNRYIIQSLINGSLGSPQFDTIKGKPVLVDEFMPDLASDALACIFGDFNGYTIVDRVGLSIQVLRELYAETNITLLLGKKRVGGYTTEPYKLKVQKIEA
jgi:HK97 family phage major capsid protein